MVPFTSKGEKLLKSAYRDITRLIGREKLCYLLWFLAPTPDASQVFYRIPHSGEGLSEQVAIYCHF